MATSKVLYEKRGPTAYVTLNRPEVKNAIDVETHERLCEIWTDFRDDPAMRSRISGGIQSTEGDFVRGRTANDRKWQGS